MAAPGRGSAVALKAITVIKPQSVHKPIATSSRPRLSDPADTIGGMSLAEVACVTIDCADPKALAKFYLQVIDSELLFEDDTYSFIGQRGAVNIAFQKVADYVAPSWPNAGSQAHIDFRVEDLATGVAKFLDLGATKPDHQPGGDTWVVLIDPEGHPFCVTASW